MATASKAKANRKAEPTPTPTTDAKKAALAEVRAGMDALQRAFVALYGGAKGTGRPIGAAFRVATLPLHRVDASDPGALAASLANRGKAIRAEAKARADALQSEAEAIAAAHDRLSAALLAGAGSGDTLPVNPAERSGASVVAIAGMLVGAETAEGRAIAAGIASAAS